MSNDSLGDRIKRYEDAYRFKLPRRVPKVLRIDGRAFHTYLRNAQKPYDYSVMRAMQGAAQALMQDIGGVARFAYIQSDECSIALNDHLDLNTQPWFDNNIQKMVSVAASVFAGQFNKIYTDANSLTEKEIANFDARVCILPDVVELHNYFLWRQQDAVRNSVQQYARSVYSHKALEGKNNSELQEMLFQKGINWNDCPAWTKRGVVVTKTEANLTPNFSTEPDFIASLYQAPCPTP